MATEPLPHQQKTLLGHPLGLYTLFFTEMWERFSFYGMKALLVLYMVEYLVWSQREASDVFKWYTTLVYFTPVLGGLIADFLLGARRSVAIGCVLITIGHTLLAFEPLVFFYTGLGFIIAGVGFLKANISTQVGSMYHPGDPRRDAAFTIFYMGINLGAFLGPLVCGGLRVTYGWHYGFGAAGVGMFFGLIVYLIGRRWVIPVDQHVDAEGHESHEAGGQQANAGVARHAKSDRLIVLVICCLFAGVFFMCFEQMPNVMLRWANDQTNLRVFSGQPVEAAVQAPEVVAAAGDSAGWRNWEMPPDWTQSINPMFILLLGPLFGWLWVWLERRKKQPSSPGKMVMGLFLVGAAYGLLILAAKAENQVSEVQLVAMPEGVDLEPYGATRLHYDADSQTLHMAGVLPDIDRLNLLSDAAPQAYKDSLEQLFEVAAQNGKEQGDGSSWQATAQLAADAPPPAVAMLPESVTWDPATRTLSVATIIPDREKLSILAAGADPQFRMAVDTIYQKSSLYRIAIWWLVFHFMLATMGELCLSPVGLSLVTKLAPPRNVGLFMGLWFVTTGSLANFLAHQIGGEWGTMTPADYFMIFTVVAGITTVLMLIMLPFLKRKMHGVH